MSKQYSLAVFIGRLQVLHLGHEKVIREALKKADRLLILIGSPSYPRTKLDSPFTLDERIWMIESVFYNEIAAEQIIIDSVEDFKYNDTAWEEQVQTIVSGYEYDSSKVALVGFAKDHTSFYLKKFPQWKSIAVEGYIPQNVPDPFYDKILSSTDIRNWFFNLGNTVNTNLVSAPVKRFLDDFKLTTHYENIKEEHKFIQTYKRGFDKCPYPPVFVTVDAVVIQSAHILLIERGARPGKGLLALPGGFINQTEKLEDAMIRELREETKIKVPDPVLRGSIVTTKVFDDPNRSSRGRTITHAYLINLTPSLQLPKVKGGDDAAKAKWFPLAGLRGEMMFDDHFAIIQNLTALL